MADIERIATATSWEPIVGYSRLVKAGDYVFISGTTAFDERGLLVGAGQMYVQARQALLNIEAALKRVNASMASVVRTRMFVTDISRFNDAARAHREFFGESRPVTSMIEVKALVNPQMLIEIEADAYVPQPRSEPAHSAAITRPAKARMMPKPAVAVNAKMKPAAKRKTSAVKPKKRK
jgi:enamine deaminase RidA (YjgF/YER057c/UK114 family)